MTKPVGLAAALQLERLQALAMSRAAERIAISKEAARSVVTQTLRQLRQQERRKRSRP
jgi:hypothetical protein